MINYYIKKYDLFILFVLIVSCFFLIKYNIFLGLLVYPYCLYLIIKKYNYLISGLLFSVIGGIYFFVLYFYGFEKVGVDIFYKGCILSAATFGLAGLLSSFIYNKIPQRISSTYLGYLYFPIIFFILKYILFGYFWGASYLLEVSVIFHSYLDVISLEWQHLLIMIGSITFFHSIFKKKIIASIIIMGMFGSLFYFNSKISYAQNNGNTIKVAMMQPNILKGDMQGLNTFSDKKEYMIGKMNIAVGEGSNLIIWPESFFYNIPEFQLGVVEEEFIKFSRINSVVIVYGAIRIIDETREVYSSAGVIDPEKGLLGYYNAQELYDRPNRFPFKKGKGPVLFDTYYGRFYILICFESLITKVAESYYNDLVEGPPDYMLVISNNEFLGESKVLDTIVWNYRELSATLDTVLLSSGNTGPTMHVSKNGAIVKKIDYNRQGILYSRIQVK